MYFHDDGEWIITPDGNYKVGIAPFRQKPDGKFAPTKPATDETIVLIAIEGPAPTQTEIIAVMPGIDSYHAQSLYDLIRLAIPEYHTIPKRSLVAAIRNAAGALLNMRKQAQPLNEDELWYSTSVTKSEGKSPEADNPP